MNKDQMKRNVHVHVRLIPTPCRLDRHGLELPAIEDEWIIQQVDEEGVTISNPRTSHVKTLGYDHIYKFTSDESRNGNKRGFLTLHVQLSIQGNEVRLRPNAKPGEPVELIRPEVVEQIVEISYPAAVGIQQRLHTEGYELGWARPEKVATRVAREGYEVVMERDARGVISTFRTSDGLVLLKRRR